MGKKLASQFPEIKTYSGQGIDDPDSILRFGWTSEDSTRSESRLATCFSFLRMHKEIPNITSAIGKKTRRICRHLSAVLLHMRNPNPDPSPLWLLLQSGNTADLHGCDCGNGRVHGLLRGTKSGALNNGIVPAINQLNAILEREFAIRLALTDEEMKIIHRSGHRSLQWNRSGYGNSKSAES